jgi:WD40 repeat protein
MSLPGEKFSTGAVSPGGQYLAVSCETPYTIALYDLKSDVVRFLTNHTELVKGMCFSWDGKLLASASVDRFVRVWDTATGKLLGELLGHVEEASDVAFSPDSKTLVSIGTSQSIKFWHLPTFREVLSLDMPEMGEKVAFSPRNDRLVFTSRHNTARVFSFSPHDAGQ